MTVAQQAELLVPSVVCSAEMAARGGFVRAFLSSALGTGLSRVLGLARDIALSNFLGAGSLADAFQLAFTAPNAFRRFVADEGLTGALIPTLADAERKEGAEQARTLANASFTILMLLCVLLAAIGMVRPDWMVTAFASPKWLAIDSQRLLAEDLTRILMPLLILVSATSFLEGLLNLRGHFFAPKVAPGLISAGIIGGLLFASGADEGSALPVYAASWGVIVGGVLHVLINVPWVLKLWGVVKPSFAWRRPRLGHLLREMSKVVLIGLAAQANILVIRQIATGIETGALSQYLFANRIIDLAQGIVAVAIGSALLPVVSKAVADADWQRFQTSLNGALRLLAFMLIPAAVALAVYATPTVSMIFRHGDFTWADTQNTASAVQWFTPFMLAVAGIGVLKKVYFSLDKRNALLVIGIFSVALTGGLGWLLAEPYGIRGIAAALSAATVIQLAIYVGVLHRDIGDKMALGKLTVPLTKMVLASSPMVPALVWVQTYGDWNKGPLSPMNWVVFLGGTALGVATYSVAAYALRIEELTSVTSRVSARFRR
jgi:putative peptidoglycan lipid II flippase